MKRVSAVRIGELANAMKGSFDKPIGTPKHWINWGIGWLAKNPQVLVEVLRPQSIVEWLGKLYEDVSTDESLQRSVISTIEQILPLWLDGAPLVQIEKVIRPKKPTIK